MQGALDSCELALCAHDTTNLLVSTRRLISKRVRQTAIVPDVRDLSLKVIDSDQAARNPTRQGTPGAVRT